MRFIRFYNEMGSIKNHTLVILDVSDKLSKRMIKSLKVIFKVIRILGWTEKICNLFLYVP